MTGKFADFPEDGPSLDDFTEGSMAWLIQRYIDDTSAMKAFGKTHLLSLRAIQRSPIGNKKAAKLKTSDLLAYARWRVQRGVGPSTINQDISYLRGPLGYAKGGWGLDDVSKAPIEEALPLLKKYNLIGKSRPRDKRPAVNEWDQLIALAKEQNESNRTEIPMDEIMEFQVWSARRIGETCRLKFADVNVEKRTCIVRDMKDPRQKKGNDHEFPLLGRAWELVEERMKEWDGHPEARIYAYNSKSVSARFYEMKKQLGIKNLRLHDLRREAASRLFEAGFSVQEVMMVTGHKTPVLLLRVYTKLKPEDLHKGPAAKRGVPPAIAVPSTSSMQSTPQHPQ